MKFDILNEPVVGSTPEAILAEMFRQLCRQMGVIPIMDTLVTNRTEELNRGSSKKRSKGPLAADVIATRMSWGTYIGLLINVLKIDNFEITTSVNFENGNSESVSVAPMTRRSLETNFTKGKQA